MSAKSWLSIAALLYGVFCFSTNAKAVDATDGQFNQNAVYKTYRQIARYDSTQYFQHIDSLKKKFPAADNSIIWDWFEANYLISEQSTAKQGLLKGVKLQENQGFLLLKDSLQLMLYRNMQITYSSVGRIDSSLWAINVGQELLERAKNNISDDYYCENRLLFNFYLGVNQNKLGNVQESLNTYHKLLNKPCKNYEPSNGFKTALLSQMARNYREINKLDSANLYIDQVLIINPKSLEALNTKALIHKDKNEFQFALSTYDKILSFIPNDKFYYLSSMFINKGLVYIKMNAWTEATEMLEFGVEKAKLANAGINLKNAYSGLVDAYSGMGNYKKAFHYQTLFYELKDSLEAADIKERIGNLESLINLQTTKIELAEEKQQKLIKEKQNEFQSNLLWIISIFLLVILTALIVLIKLNHNLKKLKLNLQASNNTKDKLFSIIAHDLKSPIIALQGIGGRLTNHLENNNTQKLKLLAPRIDEWLMRVNFMLDNLLNWSISQQNNIPINPQKHSIVDIIKDELNTSQIALANNECSLIENLQEVYWTTDKDILAIIFRNILHNAIKFSPLNTSVEVKLEMQKVPIITIIDQGPGIQQATIERIKNGNYLADYKKTGEKGFGLGLSLVLYFAKRINAQIEFHPGQEFGTKVSIQLNPLGND